MEKKSLRRPITQLNYRNCFAIIQELIEGVVALFFVSFFTLKTEALKNKNPFFLKIAVTFKSPGMPAYLFNYSLIICQPVAPVASL